MDEKSHLRYHKTREQIEQKLNCDIKPVEGWPSSLWTAPWLGGLDPLLASMEARYKKALNVAHCQLLWGPHEACL